MSILPLLRDKNKVKFLVERNMPAIILEQKIWLAYYYEEKENGKILKRPCKGYTIGREDTCKTFTEVIQDGFPGIMILPTNNIVAFDIDDQIAKDSNYAINIEETYQKYSESFSDFLAEYDPYVEVSPSGCGLRYLFTCDNKAEHLGSGRATLITEQCIGGELFVTSGFVTITGFQSDNHRDKLKLLAKPDGEQRALPKITVQNLIPWYNSKHNVVDINTKETVDLSVIKHPSIQEIKSALDCCKLDQSPLIKKAYKLVMNQEYNHYDFWMKIIMACHDYGGQTNTKTQMLTEVTNWSKTDPASFDSDQDVYDKWVSFSSAGDTPEISYRTLFKFAKHLQFDWPYPKYDSKNQNTGGPELNRIDNFIYLTQYLGINVVREPFTQELFVEGEDAVKIDEYFLKPVATANRLFGRVGPISDEALYNCMLRLAQNHGYGNIAGLRAPVDAFRGAIKTGDSIAKQWLATPFNELPEELIELHTEPDISTIEHLMSCIEFDRGQDVEQARAIMDIFFFGVVMPIYNEKRIFPEHNFMLVLTGPENIRKTTFFSNLMPDALKEYFITHSTERLDSDKSKRDLQIMMTSCMILIVDEFDMFYNPKNDSLFKNLVTSADISYVPIYEKQKKQFNRHAALCGTTNEVKINFEAYNNRRLAILKVKWFDTDNLRRINWHTFYNHYITKGKQLMMNGIYPWKMSQALINDLYQSNEQIRGKNDLELILEELFDFTHIFRGQQHIKNVQRGDGQLGLWGPKALRDLVHTYSHPKTFGINNFDRVLKRKCGAYTDTLGKSIKLKAAIGRLENGIAYQGTQDKYKRYVLPPRLTDFIPEEIE